MKSPTLRNRWLRRIAGALALIALTVVTCLGLNFVLVDDIHSYTRVMLDELYAQSGQIDTLFLGSSHCYRSFDPALVDEKLGVHSFNAGSSQQLPDGSYYLLREALGRNDLDTVYLETFFTGYNQSKSSNVPLACYLLTDYMDARSLNRYAYLWEMGGPAAFLDLIFPARHSILSPEDVPQLWIAKLTDGYEYGNYKYVTYPEDGEEYRGNGFVYTYGTSAYGFGGVLDLDADAPLSDFGWRNLERITELCREADVKLVLVTAPLPNAFADHTANYQSFVDAMTRYAAENGLEYWDFTLFRDTRLLQLGYDDFSDAHHLNGQGAEKFTAAFCEVVRARESGRDISGYFFDTLQEKLQQAPDGTYGLD
ncbi:SGNH/GDSL hydrolase family protein [uncultured Gemmiger sp.]|uniref:SGNH/GDSL hydrolase family protein n=1 Tax=uncultured Gemmiger sp. TaxID=1623490 RepID=UPI0025E616D4|nr:SGNH/GDSL hydrolase family protein [uncultured Gemmiger sp.]